MVPQVLGHERRDEIVPVIVAGVAAKLERLARLGAGRLEQLGAQLALQKLVGQTLVDQDRAGARPRADQRAGVVAAQASRAGPRYPATPSVPRGPARARRSARTRRRSGRDRGGAAPAPARRARPSSARRCHAGHGRPGSGARTAPAARASGSCPSGSAPPRILGGVDVEPGAQAEVPTGVVARKRAPRGLVSRVTSARPSPAATRCAPALIANVSSVHSSPAR